jgi:uncharacterized protein (TIGR03000 family)
LPAHPAPVIFALETLQSPQIELPRPRETGMYSIVMLTALTTAPEAPQFNGYFRDLFSRDSGYGCSGAARYSCAGCAGTVAYPTACCGCNGSVFGLGDRVRRYFERDSGYGCCGGRSYSCIGASYACSGYSCSGFAYSCFGGPAMSYTPMAAGGLSCQGGMPFAPPLAAPPAFDSFPPPPNMQGAPGFPNIPYAVPDPAPATGLRPAAHTNTALASNTPPARASVVVRLPADARLFADGRALNLTGAERKFVSPELPTNQEFVYKFTAEYERDGELVSVTKKITVRAGLTVTVAFTDLTAARPPGDTAGATTATAPNKGAVPTAQEPAKAAPVTKPTPATDTPAIPGTDRATITVKLPADATLFVDDRRSPSKDPVRSFATPPLPAGKEFAYLLKAEVIRNGQPETLTQKVPFRAGERVVVDFTSLGK